MAPAMHLTITIQNRERILDPVDKLALETVREALMQHRIATKHHSRRAMRVSSTRPRRKMGPCLDARFSRLSMPSTVADDQENGMSSDLDMPSRTAHVCDSVSTPRRKLRKLEYIKTIVSCKNLPPLGCGGNNPRALMNMVNNSDRSQCQDKVNHTDMSQGQDTNVAVLNDKVIHSDTSQGQDTNVAVLKDKVIHSDISQGQDTNVAVLKDNVNHSDISQGQDTNVPVLKDKVNHNDISKSQDTDVPILNDKVNQSNISQGQDTDVAITDVSASIGDADRLGSEKRSQCHDHECYTISDEDSPMVDDQSLQNQKNPGVAGSSDGRNKVRVSRIKPLAKSPRATKESSTEPKGGSAGDSRTTNVLAKGRDANLTDHVIVISDSESDDDIAEVTDKTLPVCSSDSAKDDPQRTHGHVIAEKNVVIESETNIVGDTKTQKANKIREPEKDVATKSRETVVLSKECGGTDLPCEKAASIDAENEKVMNVSKKQSNNSICGLEEIRSNILAELDELIQSQPVDSPVRVRNKTPELPQSVQRDGNEENATVAKVRTAPTSTTGVTIREKEVKSSGRNSQNGNAGKTNLDKSDPVIGPKGKVGGKPIASGIVATKVAQQHKSGTVDMSKGKAAVETNASGIVTTKPAQKCSSGEGNTLKVMHVAGVKANASRIVATKIAQKHKSGAEDISKVINVAGVKTSASRIIATKIAQKHKPGVENTTKEKAAVKTNAPGKVTTNVAKKLKSVIGSISTGKVSGKTSQTGFVRTTIVAPTQTFVQGKNLSSFPEKRHRQIPARKSISSVMRARSSKSHQTPAAKTKGDKLAVDNDDYVYFRFSGEECIHRNLFCGRSETNAELTLRLELLNGEIKRHKSLAATDVRSDDVARKQLSVELEAELLQSWLLYMGVGQVLFPGHPLPVTLQLGSDDGEIGERVMLLERVPTVEEYGKLYDLRQTLETSRKLHTLGIKGRYKKSVLHIVCY